MDINAAGSMYLDNQRLDPSLNGLAAYAGQKQNAANSAANFESILKKVSAGQNSAATKGGIDSHKPHIDKTDKLYEQCAALETFLIKNLISSMRNTVQKSGLIDEGFAGKMYEDMLYDEYAKDFAKNASFGLAEQAYLELTGQRGKVVIRS